MYFLDRLRSYPRIIIFYQYPNYFIDLILVSIVEFWKKNIVKSRVYYPPWIQEHSIQISLVQLLRFLRKYQPRFIQKATYLYCRSIEYLLALNWIGAQPGHRILDLGAGQSSMLAALVSKGCEVYITDGDSYVLDLKSALLKTDLCEAFTSGQLHIEVADTVSIPYPSNHFDRIVSIGAIEHLPEDKDTAAIREIARVLRPGGYVLLTLEGADQFREEWITLPFYVGKQYKPVSRMREAVDSELHSVDSISYPQFTEMKERGENPQFPMFIRSYDDNTLRERIINPSGLELVEFGYFADVLSFRAKFDRGDYFLLLRHYQPILSAILYRWYSSSNELQHRELPLAYVLLRKQT